MVCVFNGEEMRKKDLIIYKMILIALFASLSFLGTYIKIPVPGGTLHLGNYFCLLSGLLCGGLVGGLASSLGMGLCDVIFGETIFTIIRTIVVKFLYSFTGGYLFRLFLKKKIKPLYCLLGAIFISIGITILCLILYLNENISFSIIPLILSIVFIICMLLELILIKRTKIEMQKLSLAVIIASLINVFGELTFVFIYNLTIYNMAFDGAFISTLMKISSRVITGVFTSIFVILSFFPIYRSIKESNRLNDLDGYLN